MMIRIIHENFIHHRLMTIYWGYMGIMQNSYHELGVWFQSQSTNQSLGIIPVIENRWTLSEDNSIDQRIVSSLEEIEIDVLTSHWSHICHFFFGSPESHTYWPDYQPCQEFISASVAIFGPCQSCKCYQHQELENVPSQSTRSTNIQQLVKGRRILHFCPSDRNWLSCSKHAKPFPWCSPLPVFI